MRRLPLLLLLLILLAGSPPGKASAVQEEPPTAQPGQPTPTPAAGEAEPQILSPGRGQALQGSVPVVVDTTTTDFQSVELTFAYADDPTGSWFWIYQGVQPVTGTMLVLWDTSVLTDGNYRLRMQVNFSDGRQETVFVEDLRVRNYTPVETNTPMPPTPTPTSAPAQSATPLPAQATPTTLPTPAQPTVIPPNPAIVERVDLAASAALGAMMVFGLFSLGALYRLARSLRRRR